MASLASTRDSRAGRRQPTERMLRSVCVPLVVSTFEEAVSDLENDGFYSGICDMAAQMMLFG